jgi:hypothetical protein
MDWLKSDTAKNIGAVLAVIAGALLVAYPPPATIGIVAGVVVGILGALGIKSGGTKGLQPSNVVTKPPGA